MNHYSRVFLDQTGGGGTPGNFGNIYRREYKIQRGRGLGEVFTQLLRLIGPSILSGSKTIGKEILRSGGELIERFGEKPVKELLKEQGRKSIQVLGDKAENKLKRLNMDGSGFHIKRMTKRKKRVIRHPKKRVVRQASKKSKTVKKRKRTKRVSAIKVKKNLVYLRKVLGVK